jgi:hypothetical protein
VIFSACHGIRNLIAEETRDAVDAYRHSVRTAFEAP